MVRHLNRTAPSALKAALLILIAAAGLLWHLLACTESPMAFSPDGKHLAFVTVEPYDLSDVHLAGPHAYRLMVLSHGQDLKIIEQSNDAMYSAPAYSHDGQFLCYLRIGLTTRQQAQREAQAVEQRRQKRQMPASQPVNAPAPPANAPADQPPLKAQYEDHTLPSAEALAKIVEATSENAPIAASLVIRETDTYAAVLTIPIELNTMEWEDESLIMSYLTIRPQFSRDGKWIYLAAGNVLMAVDPQNNVLRILAAPVVAASLSPDGQWIAALQQPSVAFLRTDGQLALYKRWDGGKDPSPSGLAWIDEKTLAVLTQPETEGDQAKVEVRLLRTDGTLVAARPITLPRAGTRENTGELALAPDGKHMVISYGHSVYFLDTEGKVLASWLAKDAQGQEPGPDGWLVQPTFTPDSTQVAFKHLTQDADHARTKAIVFFSPEGKETSRIAIPKIDPAATRPAQ